MTVPGRFLVWGSMPPPTPGSRPSRRGPPRGRRARLLGEHSVVRADGHELRRPRWGGHTAYNLPAGDVDLTIRVPSRAPTLLWVYAAALAFLLYLAVPLGSPAPCPLDHGMSRPDSPPSRTSRPRCRGAVLGASTLTERTVTLRVAADADAESRIALTATTLTCPGPEADGVTGVDDVVTSPLVTADTAPASVIAAAG